MMPPLAFYIVYMLLSFGISLLFFRFLVWFRARKEAIKTRQARGFIRVATPSASEQATTTTTNPLGGRPHHAKTPLVTRQSFLTPHQDGVLANNCDDSIPQRSRTISNPAPDAAPTIDSLHSSIIRVRERSEFSEAELFEIAPWTAIPTAELAHEDGTKIVAPPPVYTSNPSQGPKRMYGMIRTPGTPRSATHGDVVRPVFTNKRRVSEAVTLNGDTEQEYTTGPQRACGYLRSPRTPRSPRTVTHGDAIRPVFMSRRMVSEAVTLNGDAEEVGLGWYEGVDMGGKGLRGGGEEDTVQVKKVEVKIGEEEFDPGQFLPLLDFAAKVFEEMVEEEEKIARWATAIEEAKEVVLRGWPTWESYQGYLDWAFKDEKARERMLKEWEDCVRQAAEVLAQSHGENKMEQVSVSLSEVEEGSTTAPRGTVLEAALVMRASCANLHNALKDMVEKLAWIDLSLQSKSTSTDAQLFNVVNADDTKTPLARSIHRTAHVLERLGDTCVILFHEWIGLREMKLLDGVDGWIAETEKQEIALRVLRIWKKDWSGEKRFLWNPLLRTLLQATEETVVRGFLDKRPFFGGTLETYEAPKEEVEEWCRVTGRERTLMRMWTAMSKPGARRNCKVYIDQKPAIDDYGLGDDITDKVKRPSVKTPSPKSKSTPITLTHAQATYMKNKAELNAAEKAMALRDAEFMRARLAHTPTFGRNISKIVPCLKSMVEELPEGYGVYDGDVQTCIYEKTVEVAKHEVSIRGGLLDEDGEGVKKDEVEVLVDELADTHISDVNDEEEDEEDNNLPSESDYLDRDKLHYALSFLDEVILDRLPLFEMYDMRFSLSQLHEIEKLLHNTANREFWGWRRGLRAECEYFLLSGNLCLDHEEEEVEEEEEAHVEATVNELALPITYSVPLNWFPWVVVHEDEHDSESDSDATIDYAEVVPLPDSDSDSDLHDHTYGIPNPNPSIPICAPLNWFPWFKTHQTASSIIEAEKRFTCETESDARAAVKKLLDAASDARGRPSRAGHLKKHPDLWTWQCQDHATACSECRMVSSSPLSSESVRSRARREMSLRKLQFLSRKNMGQVRTAVALRELEEAMEATAFDDFSDPDVQALWKDAAYLWLAGHLPVKTLMSDAEIDAGPSGPGMIIVRLRLMLFELEERGEIITAFNREHPNDMVDQEEVFQIQLQVTKIDIALLSIEAKMSMDELQGRLCDRLDLGTRVEGRVGEMMEDSLAKMLKKTVHFRKGWECIEENISRPTSLRGGYFEDDEEDDDDEEKDGTVIHMEDLAPLASSIQASFLHDSLNESSDHSSQSSTFAATSASSEEFVFSPVHSDAISPTATRTPAPFTPFQDPDGTWKTLEDIRNTMPWAEWTHWQGLQLNAGHLWEVAEFFQHKTMWRQFVIDTAKGNFAECKVPRARCVDSTPTSRDGEKDGEDSDFRSQSLYDVCDDLGDPKQRVKMEGVDFVGIEHVADRVSFASTWTEHIEVVNSDGKDCDAAEKCLRRLLELHLCFEEIEGAMLATVHDDVIHEIEMLTTVNEELAEHHHPIDDAFALLSSPSTGSLRATCKAKQEHGQFCRRFCPYPKMSRCLSSVARERVRRPVEPRLKITVLQEGYAARPLSPIPKEGTRQGGHIDLSPHTYTRFSLSTPISRSPASIRGGGIEFSSIVESGSQFGPEVAWAAFKFLYDLEEPIDRFAFHNSDRSMDLPMLPNDLQYGRGKERLLSAYGRDMEKRRADWKAGIERTTWVRENSKLWFGEKWTFPRESGVYLRSDRAMKLMGLRAFWDKDPRCGRSNQRVGKRDEVVRQRTVERNGTIRRFLQKRVTARSEWSRGQRRVRDVKMEDPRADVFVGNLRGGALEVWECQVCRDLFSTSHALELHKRTRTSQQPFTSWEEGSRYYEAAEAAQVLLTMHMNPGNLEKDTTSRGPNERCQCTICGEWFAKVEQWGEHWMGHLKGDSMRDFAPQADNGDALGPYRCLFCDAEFSTPQSLTSHKQMHTEKNPFKSQELDCGYEGPQDSQFNMHTRNKHTEEKPLAFPEPGVGDRSELLACRWQNHPSAPPCGLPCSSKADLQAHIEYTHTAHLSKKHLGFICRWSGCARLSLPSESSEFAQRSKLDRHMQTHTGFKASRCPRCDREFATSKSLQTHMRTHTGERPFECNVPECHYAAAQASQLTMHQRAKHTKEKPLVCLKPGCGMRFVESSNLSKHRKIHEPEENIKCDVCCKGFKRRDQLRRHIKIHMRKDARYENRDDVMDIDDMVELPSPPPPTPHQGPQTPPAKPALPDALPAPQQRLGTLIPIPSSYLGGRTDEQHVAGCRPARCARGCTATSTLPEDDERPRGGALSLDTEAYPWGRHTVCCRADSCVMGCRSILTLPHQRSDFRVDKMPLEASKGVTQALWFRLFLPHPRQVLSMTPWSQGLAERPARIPDWGPTVPKHGEGLRDCADAVKIEATDPLPRALRGYGSHESRGQSPACSSNNSRASSRNESRSASIKRSKIPHSLTSAELLGLGATEDETNGGKSRQGDDSERLRGGALDKVAESSWAEALRRETKLAPWGRHAEECRARSCAIACKSILSLPHDRFAFGVDTARLATSLPDGRTSLPSVSQPRQVSAPTSQTEVVAPRPIPIPHSLTRQESEESEGLRGGALDEDDKGNGLVGRHTESCCAERCAMDCSSILSLLHARDELSAGKAPVDISVTVTETQDEPPLTKDGDRRSLHTVGCCPGYCARGCRTIPTLLSARGDSTQVDNDSVGQWRYLFKRNVVPSLNSFASMRSEMLGRCDGGDEEAGDEETGEEECGGGLTLSSSAPPAFPTQVSTQIPQSKDAISGRRLRDGGRFTFKGGYARKQSDFANPRDQLPSWRLGPWIGHDMGCRRVRCALGCRATITLKSMASWSKGKHLALEMWVVDPVSSSHGDGVLAKAFEDARVPSLSEDAVTRERSSTAPLLRAFSAAASTIVKPDDIMLKDPIVMEELLPNPSSEGRLRGGALQCTKKKAGWLIDERLRSSFTPANRIRRPEPDLPDSPPLTPSLGPSIDQANIAKNVFKFVPLLPPSPPQSRNNSPAKVEASRPFNPYLVWPSDAPFLPPLKGYWSPEYDKSGFWRRPVCPGELHKRLSFLPETGRFRWCGDGTIERANSLQESEDEFEELCLRGGGMEDERCEWVEDVSFTESVLDSDHGSTVLTLETPESPPDSSSDDDCEQDSKKSEYPLMPLLTGLWPGWVNEDEEETPVLESPRKRKLDEMLDQMDLEDGKEPALPSVHHDFRLEDEVVDITYPEMDEPSRPVLILEDDYDCDTICPNDDPPSIFSFRIPHEVVMPIYSPDASTTSLLSSSYLDEDTENRSVYCAAPRRLTQIMVGECKQFSRTLMHHGTGLLMMHRDWCAGTPSRMRYMQDAYSWRQHLMEARAWEERLREKMRRRGIELAREAEDGKDSSNDSWGLSQVVELRTRNEGDVSLMSFKPFKGPDEPEDRRGQRKESKYEHVTRLVRGHFKQRCQWRFSWEDWNEQEDLVRHSLYPERESDSDNEGGCVIFERREKESMRGGYGLLAKKTRWGVRRERSKKRRERKMRYRHAVLWKERKKAWNTDFS